MDRAAVLDRVRDALARGEYLVAYDEAHEAALAFPSDVQVRYYAALALARAGAGMRAAEELSQLPDGETASGDLPTALIEDVAALGARLAKDRALRATGIERKRLARESAERYEAIYRRVDRPFSCVNAATMWRVAGDDAQSAALARAALRLVADAPVETDEGRYWNAATEAEAALLLGDAGRARAALERAARLSVRDYASRASTRRQLALVCAETAIATELLDALPIPAVVHYCGHRVSRRFPAAEEPRVASEIAAYLDRHDVGFAYGSLASGADLLVAEAVLAKGAELHAFLPFGADEFVTTSVEPAGPEWVARFEAARDGALSVTYTDDGPFLDDEVLFEYCSRVAMGRAIVRSSFLTAAVGQVAIWDGQSSGSNVGTGADVATWERGGRSSHVIESGGRETVDTSAAEVGGRQIRAMLFADVAGYSRLHDGHMAAFSAAILEPLAAALTPYEHAILNRRSWGDSIHVVFADVIAAAQCALDLQATMDAVEWEAAGLPHRPRLRVGAHVGPVFEIHDPIRGGPDFTGSHVVRSARIEPRTPEGDVYVTDAFAALVALEGDRSFSCEYVGHVPTAKDYGTFPMYVLKRTGPEL